MAKAGKHDHAARRQRLRATLKSDRNGLDAMLVSYANDIRYLTGFSGHDSLLLIDADEAVIISDNRYETALRDWAEGGDVGVVMGVRHQLATAVEAQSRRMNIGRLGVQSEYVTIAQRKAIAGAVAKTNAEVVDTLGTVGQHRICKDDVEVAAIGNSLQIQQRALSAALDELRIGMTEREFAALLEYQIKKQGGDRSSFAPIVAVGANAALPHYETGDVPIGEGVLLIDWGAQCDGYAGDLTRTFFIGNAPDKMREVYEIVLEAQLKAIECCAPGKTCASVDAIARKHIADAGYGEYFVHGLGHGLGMDVHEPPFFNEHSEIALEPGMVMTVEPGIYLPGVGGVRIEDDVVITDDGCRVLSDYPKQPEQAVLDLAVTA